MKKKLEYVLNNPTFEKFILFLIFLNLIILILDSVSSFHSLFFGFIRKVEILTIFIFTVEYLMRIFTINRLSELFKPMLLIDFLAIAPFYLFFCSLNTGFLRILRFLRFMRILKVGRYTEAFHNIQVAFLSKKEELIITFSIFGIGVLLSAILMYFAEYDVQPDVFSSIPKCLYFSIITFTTIGYGDITPLTVLGKIISCISAIFGVGLHGLFIGIIGTAFISAFKKEDI